MQTRKISESPNSLPDWFKKEPSHLEGIYFTFPVKFLEEFKKLEPAWFSELKFNRELSLASTLSHKTVGFNCGTTFGSDHLSRSVEYDPAFFGLAAKMFAVPAKVSFEEKAARSPISYVNQLQKVGRAYLGWLVQEPDYWDALSYLKDEFEVELQGMPFPQALLNGGQELEVKEDASEREKNFIKAVQDVCIRWRISSFRAIECPILKTPKTSGLFDGDVPDGVHKPLLPDIYPIEGSGAHVEQMNERRNATLPKHLAGWAEISSKDANNTKPYESLARQYQIQHIYRLMESRRPGCLKRKLRSLKPILAAYLDVSLATLTRDLAALKTPPVNILELPLEIRF